MQPRAYEPRLREMSEQPSQRPACEVNVRQHFFVPSWSSLSLLAPQPRSHSQLFQGLSSTHLLGIRREGWDKGRRSEGGKGGGRNQAKEGGKKERKAEREPRRSHKSTWGKKDSEVFHYIKAPTRDIGWEEWFGWSAIQNPFVSQTQLRKIVPNSK